MNIEEVQKIDEFIISLELDANQNQSNEKKFEKFRGLLQPFLNQMELLDGSLSKWFKFLLKSVIYVKSLPVILFVEAENVTEAVLAEQGKISLGFKVLYELCSVRSFKIARQFFPQERTHLPLLHDILRKIRLHLDAKTLSNVFELHELLTVAFTWTSLLLESPFAFSSRDTFAWQDLL